MPELPEVETIARDLAAVAQGQTITQVQVLRDLPLQGLGVTPFRQALESQTLHSIQRRGKVLLFALSSGGVLAAHLRMTGKFVYLPPPAPKKPPGPHVRVVFRLASGAALLYQDVRCLGTLTLAPSRQAWEQQAGLGPEPLAPEFDVQRLAQALGHSTRPLKPWLMDPRQVAGIGNIYAAEILFQAQLSPLRAAGRLTAPEVARLHRAMQDVLQRAIAANGTTISDYRRVDDKTGTFQNFLQVYGKAGQPCPHCRQPIQRIIQQQRSTFYCANCQGEGVSPLPPNPHPQQGP